MTENPQQPYQQAPAPPPDQQQVPRQKFSGLAWAALIVGIVGIVGSPIIFLNNLTAVAAGVGVVLGIIALFGTKKVVAAIGTVLCIAGIAITVSVQQATVEGLNDLGEQLQAPIGEPASGGDSAADVTYKVGETHQGERLSITVGSARDVTTSGSAYPAANATVTAYDVTITNNGDKPYPPLTLSFTATAGDRPAQQVYDTGSGIEGAPPTDVLPGKSVTFTIAFTQGPGDMLVQVRAMNGDTIYFTHARS